MSTLSRKHGRDLERYGYIWSNKQCTICGILVVGNREDVYEDSSRPTWHMDVNGVCALCLAENIVRSMGLNSDSLVDSKVLEDTDLFLETIDLLFANYVPHDPISSP